MNTKRTSDNVRQLWLALLDAWPHAAARTLGAQREQIHSCLSALLLAAVAAGFVAKANIAAPIGSITSHDSSYHVR